MAAFLNRIMTNGSWQEQEQQDYEDRWLTGDYSNAEAKYPEAAIDYSVLSVGVVTLGLILVVEVIRQKLDYIATHRPFFKVVLKAAYSELTTLGLVELFVFWFQRYIGVKNKERKQLFAEVHFALFYTAIFNVFQSVICAFATRKSSHRLWVQTEHLELDHYVEIREEFDRVSKLYNEKRGTSCFGNFKSTIQNPGLQSRHLELLVQVRFHQLRVQFLETNSLPITLKVSDYLKRSEEAVLMHMVHVSGTAWLLLTGFFSLIYYLLGIVVNQTGDSEIVGRAMAAIFFSILFLFIFICIMLYIKMKHIFEDILEAKHIQETDGDEGAQHQLQLFWFSEPQLVIALIQFMQFGYAIALAIVLMFWENLGEVEPYYYLLTTLSCYAVFVYVLAKVLPQFTLCTSLGYLVNKERLNETLAFHRFREAQRRQKQKSVQLTFAENLDDAFVRVQKIGAMTKGDDKMTAVILEMDPAVKDRGTDGLSTARTSVSSRSSSRRAEGHRTENTLPTGSMSRSAFTQSMKSITSRTSELSAILMADLVKMDTSQLRQQLPNDMIHRDQPKSRRSNRRKSVSDGVQAMRAIEIQVPPPGTAGPLNVLAPRVDQSAVQPDITDACDASLVDAEQAHQDRATRLANRRASRRKSVSASGVIQAWRALDNDERRHSNNSKTVRSETPVADTSKGRRRRHRRQKSASDPDLIQRWQFRNLIQDGLNSVPEHPIMTQQKSTDDPAILHRRLRAERMSQERRNRRKTKSLSASAVIQSWQRYSMADPLTGSNNDSQVDDVFFSDSNNRQGDKETELEDDKLAAGVAVAPASASAMVSKDEDNQEELDDLFAVVNPADASLLESRDEPRTRKSVGFLSLDCDRSESSLAQKRSTDDDDDDSTYDTGKSVGELSDVGQATMHGMGSLRSTHWEEPWHVKVRQRLSPSKIKNIAHDFFVLGHHASISHVFGSITIFFLIGSRLESFNAVTGVYVPSESTWEMKLNVAFWWQATWYAVFLIMSGLVMWAVHPSECKSIPEKQAFAAAVMDIFLSTVCMTLLFVADSKRCCNVELSNTISAAHLDDKSDSVGESSVNAYQDDIYSQCCPFWGYRTYGGYGNIEPFTALIGLRVLRFYLSKRIVRFMAKKDGGSEPGLISLSKEHSSADLQKGDGHNSGHGTAVELWQRTISKHPEIADKYGQFSAEVLQAMLGLEIYEADDQATKSFSSINQHMRPSMSTGDLQALEACAEDKEMSNQPHFKLNGEQYSSLSAESQGIILAGKLGKPVRSSMVNLRMEHFMDQFTSVGDLPALAEESAADRDLFHIKPSTTLEFEVDGQLLEKEDNADSKFIAPNARLIRSMRRCDRILYPLLKEWTPVDVVITNYEIVYFDVENEKEENPSPELHSQKEALRAALEVTKGGKGLRLVDVAAGRKVVGHLDLADITQVHVERHMPRLDVAHLERDEESIDAGNQLASEYWQNPSHNEVQRPSRKVRWAKVKEDRLKIVSIHGTLLLRYYSDLNDVEANPEAYNAEDELIGPLKKDISLQWAQTLAHLCGADQLKQSLPNFGRNDSEELRDYLEVFHHKSAETKHRRRTSAFMSSGRISIFAHAAPTAEDAELNKPKLQYSRSLGDAVLEKKPIPRLLRRISSVREHDHIPSRPRSRSDNASEDIEIGNTPRGLEEDHTTGPAAEDPGLNKPKLRYSRSLGDAILENTPMSRLFRRGSSVHEDDQTPSRPRTRSGNVSEDVEIGNIPSCLEDECYSA